MSGRYYVAVDVSSGDTLPGLPTPMLISVGGGEAWQQHPGIWRLREKSDPPGVTYTRVRISRSCARCDQAINIGRDSVSDAFGEPMHWQHVAADRAREREEYGT